MFEQPSVEARLQEQLTADFGYVVDAATVLVDMQSAYQRIQVLRTATFGNMLRLDGALQCSERDEFFYHEPLVHMAMAHVAVPRRVLIVGGGDGGAAEEALKWPTAQLVDHVEIDPLVLSLCERHLGSVHRGVLSGADFRYQQHVCDGAAWVKNVRLQSGTYDNIILDLTDAGGPSAALYGAAFYDDCSTALAPDGVLTLHVAAPWAQQARCALTVSQLRAAFAFVEPFVVSVPMSGGQWLMAACHNQPARFARSVDVLARRLGRLRGPALQVVDAHSLVSMLQLPPYLTRAFAPRS